MQQVVQTASRQNLSRFRNAQVEAFAAWLSLMQEDEAAVLRWQERCALTLDGQVSHVREREYLTLVRVLLTRRRLDEARAWLASLVQLAEPEGYIRLFVDEGVAMAHLLERLPTDWSLP